MLGTINISNIVFNKIKQLKNIKNIKVNFQIHYTFQAHYTCFSVLENFVYKCTSKRTIMLPNALLHNKIFRKYILLRNLIFIFRCCDCFPVEQWILTEQLELFESNENNRLTFLLKYSATKKSKWCLKTPWFKCVLG